MPIWIAVSRLKLDEKSIDGGLIDQIGFQKLEHYQTLPRRPAVLRMILVCGNFTKLSESYYKSLLLRAYYTELFPFQSGGFHELSRC